MKPKVAIIGSGGHARVVVEAIRRAGQMEIWGILDDDVNRHGEMLDGITVIGGISLLCDRSADVEFVVVAIGSNRDRLRLASVVTGWAYQLGTVIHPAASVATGVEIGPGSVLMAGSVVQPGAQIGSFAIINTAATVDHDCIVGSCAHLAPGVHLGGNVSVGRGTLMGIGSLVRPGVSVGEWSVVGMGSVVVSDIPSGVVAFGVPAAVRHAVAEDEAGGPSHQR
ncbi:MAG TPA: acetyltransferase [Armatimonadota bacterium]|jgi:sugar O-acyltransferase (sialic acid O-acetyltransferase NeuD family)